MARIIIPTIMPVFFLGLSLNTISPPGFIGVVVGGSVGILSFDCIYSFPLMLLFYHNCDTIYRVKSEVIC